MLEQNEKKCWFQQDEATTYTAKTTKAFLQDLFGNCIVECGL
jgi:hypothetical protein